MKNKKSIFDKILTILLIAIMCMSIIFVSSCSKNEKDTSNNSSDTQESTQGDNETSNDNTESASGTNPSDNGKDEKALEYRLKDDGTYEVAGIGNITEKDIVIDKTYKEKAVTSIGERAFYDCADITSITIPEGITSIGTLAFNGCIGLTSLTLPSSITSIEHSAFNGCYRLVEICNLSALNIQRGSYDNGYIARYALNVYTSDSGEKKTSITNDGYVFYENNDVCYLVGYNGDDKELTLPQNCNSKAYEILDFAFYGNTSITSVTIPNSVTSIYDVAFYGCSGLTNVTIGSGVKYIGPYVFDGCVRLTSVTFENTDGWFVSTSDNATSGKNINPSKASTAAKYLTDTYCDYHWYCK